MEEVFNLADGDKQQTVEKQESTKEEVKVEVKPYMVFGQDFSLSNSYVIDYYKTRAKMMAIKFKLVGRFNENGLYKVANNIRYDLIKMEKEIDDSGEDFYKAIALYMKKYFYFHVKIEVIDEGKAKASLYLSEYVEDFLGENYITTHVADFIDVYDEEFRIKVRKAFNLVDVATRIDDFAVPELAVVMQDAFDLELVVGGLYDMASQIFVMRMLKALEENGEKGAKVLSRYRQLLAESKDIEINEKYRYSHYKALLDRAVDENGGYEKIGVETKVVESIMKDMNGTVKAIEKASGKGIIELDGPIKRYELNEGGSSGGKSGGKGGNKNKGSSDKGKEKNKKDKKEKDKKAKNTKKASSSSDSSSSNNEQEEVVIVEIEESTPNEIEITQGGRRSVPPSRARRGGRLIRKVEEEDEEELEDEDETAVENELEEDEDETAVENENREQDDILINEENQGEAIIDEVIVTETITKEERVLEDGTREIITKKEIDVEIHGKTKNAEKADIDEEEMEQE